MLHILWALTQFLCYTVYWSLWRTLSLPLELYRLATFGYNFLVTIGLKLIMAASFLLICWEGFDKGSLDVRMSLFAGLVAPAILGAILPTYWPIPRPIWRLRWSFTWPARKQTSKPEKRQIARAVVGKGYKAVPLKTIMRQLPPHLQLLLAGGGENPVPVIDAMPSGSMSDKKSENPKNMAHSQPKQGASGGKAEPVQQSAPETVADISASISTEDHTSLAPKAPVPPA